VLQCVVAVCCCSVLLLLIDARSGLFISARLLPLAASFLGVLQCMLQCVAVHVAVCCCNVLLQYVVVCCSVLLRCVTASD